MNFRHDDATAGAAVTAIRAEKMPPQVLVVDDSHQIREFVALLLRLSGYRVLKAPDGVAAQEILKTEHPDLVISDLEMPVCDGWDMLAYCHECHPALPVLIISGTSLGRKPEIERWASGFISKPFNLPQFRSEVQRLLPRAA